MIRLLNKRVSTELHLIETEDSYIVSVFDVDSLEYFPITKTFNKKEENAYKKALKYYRGYPKE